MRRWNSPAVNSIHAMLVAMNVTAGLIVHYRLHHWYSGWFSFFACFFIIAVNIYGGLMNRRLALLRQAVAAELDRVNGEMDQMDQQSLQLARENLNRVAQVLGARVDDTVRAAEIVIGPYHYLITGNSISRRPRTLVGRDILRQRAEYTCLMTFPMPYPERIASAMLLLKNDPTVFERWQAHDNYHA